MDAERPNPVVTWECGFRVGSEEWFAHVLQGVQDHDLSAPRMPEWMVRDCMADWEMSRRETIWRTYLPHIPYTERLSIKEASDIFPYREHAKERAKRAKWTERLRRGQDTAARSCGGEKVHGPNAADGVRADPKIQGGDDPTDFISCIGTGVPDGYGDTRERPTAEKSDIS